MSAAIAARRAGCAVTIVDERAHAGGQYFKQLSVGGADPPDAQHREGERLIATARELGVEFEERVTVWGAFPPERVRGRRQWPRAALSPASDDHRDRRLRARLAGPGLDFAGRDDDGCCANPVAHRAPAARQARIDRWQRPAQSATDRRIDRGRRRGCCRCRSGGEARLGATPRAARDDGSGAGPGARRSQVSCAGGAPDMRG